MTRSKVKLEFIRNEAARKATYKKRKKGMLKKLEELTTLCAVDACAIIRSPYEDRPEAWPSASGARRVLARFSGLPEEDRAKKMLDQESYLKQRVAKAAQLLEKVEGEVCEKESLALMFDCLEGIKRLEGLDLEEVKDVRAVAERTLAAVVEAKRRFSGGDNDGTSSSSSSSSNWSAENENENENEDENVQ